MKRRLRRAFVCENLEPRNLLAAAPIISEFVADNNGGLTDGHGASPDWIELYNAGDAAVDLAGYHLTDTTLNLVRWTFPSTVLDAGEFLVVFASGNDAPDPQGNLHTNFSLNDQGEYLALVAPNGTTILSEFTPAYPVQRSNVSYGVAQTVTQTPLISPGSAARMLVPTASDDAAIGSSWTGGQAFNHSAWTPTTLAVGYDLGGEQTQSVLGNIARGRQTTQSTDGFGLTGAPAVDGNFANLTHTASNDLTPWHETNLGAPALISKVDVFHRGDNCCPERFYNIRIEIRDAANAVVYTSPVYNPWNGSTPAAPPVPSTNSYSVDLSSMPGGGVVGSKVRVTKQAFLGSEWLSLGEVEVTANADLPVTSNVAVGKPTTASGPLWASFNNPQLITDGSRATFTHPASQVNTFHYDIDLGETTAIDKINVVNRGDGCCPERLTNYRVSVYNDDDGEFGEVVWTADVRTNGTNSGNGGVDALTANLDPDGTFAGRFIRVEKINSAVVNYWPQIAEVEVLVPNGYSHLIATNVQSAMSGVNASAYVRVPFDVADPSAFDALKLRMKADDGFVAYLNGVEVARRHAPAGTPAYNASATGTHYAVNAAEYDISASLLVPGTNILAFHALNRSATDHDYLLSPELTALAINSGVPGYFATPSPGNPNGASVAGFVEDTQFSGDPLVFNGRGFYDAPFDVTLSTATAGATIIYTTDGSAPTLTHGTKILPANSATAPTGNVHITTTTSLRAAAFKSGFQPTNVDTQTYLFLNHVIGQPEVPAGVPATWNGTAAQYGMDPEVVNNPAYSDEIIDGLRSIPTMSIVMDPDDFYGSADGIYIYPERLGIEYERPVSIEVISPDGTTLFQEDAGIRVWGTGWRPHSSTLKHSFQLKFKNIYGKGKLDSQLFPDAPVNEFDDIILRAQGSRGWTDFRNGPLEIASTQYIHDNWARDTALAMGKHDGHGTYVHLYINGLYWGLYNPVERPTGNFGEEYFGGDNEDFDVLSHRTGQAVVANEGELTAWNQVLALADAGTANAANYAGIEQLVDLDNLIDYMLINQYATNHDGPSNGGNNMRVLRKREPGGKFMFYVWDMEYTFWNASENSNINDVNHAGTIGHLFTRLRDNAEFRQRFSDRAHMHLTGDGALTPANAAARWQARADEIYTAVIAESARWGDNRREPPFTRDVEWAAELNRLMTQYFPTRTATLISHLQSANLWIDVTTPTFNQDGGTVPPGFQLTMTAPATGGFVDTPLIAPYAQANYWIPTSDALGQTWTTANFTPPAGWSTGQTGIGYDNQTVAPAVNYLPEIKTDIGLATPSNAEPTAIFLRLPFDVASPAAVQQLTLRMRYDDGFVAYLNGTEVARRLAPGVAGTPLAYTALATSGRADSQSLVPEDIDISSFKNLLVADTTGSRENVLAIHALNAAASSNDFLILPELVSRAPDPNPQSSPIYFTIDGSDPRMAGGGISPAATLYSSAVTVNQSQLVTARALRNGQWSAPNTAQFSVPPLLRVEEVMYHPVDGDAEFIEITNIGTVPADLAGVELAGGVTFTFLGGTLAPGARTVVVRDLAAFEANYGSGISIAGQYNGSLSNSGDTITLLDAGGGTIQSFTFDDDPITWYPTTDGGGHSLVIRDVLAPIATWDTPAAWRASGNIGGSPGEEDSTFVDGDINGDQHVNLLDLAILQSHFGMATGATRAQGDLNGDGAIDRKDAAVLSANFGQTAGSPSPAASPASVVAATERRRLDAPRAEATTIVARHRRAIVASSVATAEAADRAITEDAEVRSVLSARRLRSVSRR